MYSTKAKRTVFTSSSIYKTIKLLVLLILIAKMFFAFKNYFNFNKNNHLSLQNLQ